MSNICIMKFWWKFELLKRQTIYFNNLRYPTYYRYPLTQHFCCQDKPPLTNSRRSLIGPILSNTHIDIHSTLFHFWTSPLLSQSTKPHKPPIRLEFLPQSVWKSYHNYLDHCDSVITVCPDNIPILNCVI